MTDIRLRQAASVCASVAADMTSYRQALLAFGLGDEDPLVVRLDELRREFASAATHLVGVEVWADVPRARRSFPGDDSICDPR